MFVTTILLPVLLSIYVLICIIAYLLQEKLIFHPDRLGKDFEFTFLADFEELYLAMKDGIHLHALHFKALNPKGIVFYIHGNAGSLEDWGGLSELYIELGYDLFMFDYRGFGKSEGKISSQKQFFEDVQAMYDYVKTWYNESQIIVEGFSIGTATACKIAVDNKPRHLILKAPYYSLPYLVKSRHPYLPASLLKYQFKTIDFLKQVKIPVTIFHGTSDELIPYVNAERLSQEVPTAEFVTVPNCLHNDIPFSNIYKEKMEQLLK